MLRNAQNLELPMGIQNVFAEMISISPDQNPWQMWLVLFYVFCPLVAVDAENIEMLVECWLTC